MTSTTVNHSQLRSASSQINYDNIQSFTKFPTGIELPAPITKAMIDKINKTGSHDGGGTKNQGVGIQLAPGFVVHASTATTSSSTDTSLVTSNNHMSMYHPDQSKPRPVTSVYDIKDPSKMKKEYREDYFKQYNRFHRPHVFEILIDNQTLQPVPIPSADEILRTQSESAHKKSSLPFGARINLG